MWPDSVVNLGPLAFESVALPTVLGSLARFKLVSQQYKIRHALKLNH